MGPGQEGQRGRIAYSRPLASWCWAWGVVAVASLGHPCLGALEPRWRGVVGRKGPSLRAEA